MNDFPLPDFEDAPASWRGRGLPVAYSCSGCSSSAQLAHYVAVQLDRRGLARMSCIAALSADVAQIVSDLRCASQVIAIDACDFLCAKRAVERHRIKPHHHYRVVARESLAGAALEDEAERIIERVLADILRPVHGVR